MKTKKTNTLAVKLTDSLLDEENSMVASVEATKSLAIVNLPEATASDATAQAVNDDKTVDLSAARPVAAHPDADKEPTIKMKVVDLDGPIHLNSTRTVRPNHLSPSEAAVIESDSLRVAQNRILELEKEIDRLRMENFELAQAGKTLQRKADEMISRVETAENKVSEAHKILNEEKAIFKTSLKSKEKEIRDLRNKNEILESRLETDFKRIRIRERELEHRLELMKVEHSSVIRAKDDMMMDLRRKLDQIETESENYRTKGQELYKKLAESDETMRRVVRALRIALTIVEGSESDEDPGDETGGQG
jgi:chromosome segregation ATPase